MLTIREREDIICKKENFMAVHKFNSRLVEIEFKRGGTGTISLPFVYNLPLINYYLQANKMPLTKFCDKVGIDYFRFNDFMNGDRVDIDFLRLSE